MCFPNSVAPIAPPYNVHNLVSSLIAHTDFHMSRLSRGQNVTPIVYYGAI